MNIIAHFYVFFNSIHQGQKPVCARKNLAFFGTLQNIVLCADGTGVGQSNSKRNKL